MVVWSEITESSSYTIASFFKKDNIKFDNKQQVHTIFKIF